jgi:NAD(P)-dependent dehydrogenase (short-subunit alcohol dehydrogenase family)
LNLARRVVVVTGAARGLGRAESIALARRGALVLAVDVLDTTETIKAIEGEGCQALGLQVDLVDRDSSESVVDAALEAYGQLDVLVNNAGILRDRMSFNLSEHDWNLVLAVNLSATFYLARAAIRYWREKYKGGQRRGGTIVNTTSESGLFGNAGQANYAAAKAGVAALTRTLATEVERYGIRVNAIAPRARTPMSEGMGWKLPRTQCLDSFAPEHVGNVVAWLASDAARDVTGQVLVVHGAAIEVMQPWSVRHRVAHHGAWNDEELLGLGDELFPDGAARSLAPPVHRLFSARTDREEAIDHHIDSQS